MEVAEGCNPNQNRPPFTILASTEAVDPMIADDFGLEKYEATKYRRSGNTGFKKRQFSNGDLRPAESQVNYKYVQMDVGTLTGDLSPNIHRSTTIASIIRFACFCLLSNHSLFNRVLPEGLLQQGLWASSSTPSATRSHVGPTLARDASRCPSDGTGAASAPVTDGRCPMGPHTGEQQHCIATGLRQASSKIKNIFEEVAINGMYDPAKCLALQMEVRNMPTSRYDRWAFECCDKISQQVVLAAPNAMGHMKNEEFVLAITRYFGQQNFISRSREGLYFGKNRDRADTFGLNLCCAFLLGGGFRILHDQVKTLIITFFRLAGVTANDEDALWMLGRVPDPYMRR
ncbi:hypothetical protein THAOC_07897, partial [Thalassiosira oceanica]